MASKPHARLVLISGGTCSGKTTMAKAIGKRMQELKTVILSHDNYYKDLSHLSQTEANKTNFDHPDSIEFPYLYQDVLSILKGETVNIPDYDFVTHKRSEGKMCVAGAEVLILEGIFALYYPELVELADLKIFVDTDADLRLARRIYRDIRDRGFNIDSVIEQYVDTVRPSHMAFIEPSKKNADVIISGEREFDKVLYLLNGFLLYESRRVL
ncbi:MAG: uridine kinase [Candidatus Cloacimonetes bacterium]|nr:uridine kinase [Candidatus Cloacimonadota bacterium]